MERAGLKLAGGVVVGGPAHVDDAVLLRALERELGDGVEARAEQEDAAEHPLHATYPFTPPSCRPLTRNFWNVTNTMRSGTTFITVAAMMSSVCRPYVESRASIPTDMG